MDIEFEDLRPQVLQNTLEQLSSSSSSGRDTECCVICLSDLTEHCEAQPCQHYNFDYHCLIAWLREQQTCPLCKSIIHEIRYELSEDGKHGKVLNVAELRKETDTFSTRDGQDYGELTSFSENQSTNNFRRSAQTLQSYDDRALRRRRLVYEHKLFSLHVGSNKRQPPTSRYRELLPQLFISDPELLSRAREWLLRELQVFDFLYGNENSLQHQSSAHRRKPRKAEFLLEYIIAILKTIDIQSSSGQAEELIQEFLGRENTQLFLHELKAWLRSPYRSLCGWDRAVQYNANALPRVSWNTGSESN